MKELLFDKPAESWEEALPLGNGFLGAMIHGRTRKELIEFNEDSLWSGGPTERYNPLSIDYINKIRSLLSEGEVEEAEKWAERSFLPLIPHSKHYELMGQVWLDFKDYKEPHNYERRLDLENAVYNMAYETDKNVYKREAFISYPDKVFVYRIESNNPAGLSFDLHVTRRDTRSGKTISYLDSVEYEDGILYLNGYNGNKKIGIDYTMAVCIKIDVGTVEAYGNRVVVENCTRAMIYVTGRTSYRSDNPKEWCKTILLNAANNNYEHMKDNHMEDFQYYFNQMHLNLTKRSERMTTTQRLTEVKQGFLHPDFIELYFNFGRYLMISSSREGSLPANLQGIWSNEFGPSWGSKYTININLEMNYWLCEKTGLSSLHMPLMEHLKTMLPRGKEIAKAVYGLDGACAHHVTDLWGDCAPMDYNISATLWPFGLVWLSLHIMEHFQYTKDDAFLNEYYPILEENVKFLLGYMFKDKNGLYASGPSSSPENVYITSTGAKACVCLSPAMDIQMIREFFLGYLDICEYLQDNTYIAQIREHLEHMPKDKIGKYGQLMEWQEDYEEEEPGHRHTAHLFALHPGTQITVEDTPELAEAAKVTLRRRLQNGGAHTGWSCAWLLHFYARLHEPEKGFEILKKQFSELTLDNLFDNCPPFQIDGNFGGTDAILEFIVQDYGKRVTILPALPKVLGEGNIERYRLKCGAELTFSWNESCVKSLCIKAVRDMKTLLIIDDKETIVELKKNEVFSYEV